MILDFILVQMLADAPTGAANSPPIESQVLLILVCIPVLYVILRFIRLQIRIGADIFRYLFHRW